MNDSAKHLDGLDALDLAAAILAELGNPTDEQVAAWNRDAEAGQAVITAELLSLLDSIDASDSTSELLEMLESSQLIDEFDDGYDLAGLLDLLESPPQVVDRDEGEDLTDLLDLLESPDPCEAALHEINKQRERIIRKRYGRGR